LTNALRTKYRPKMAATSAIVPPNTGHRERRAEAGRGGRDCGPVDFGGRGCGPLGFG
jgi:hypothetical protein